MSYSTGQAVLPKVRPYIPLGLSGLCGAVDSGNDYLSGNEGKHRGIRITERSTTKCRSRSKGKVIYLRHQTTPESKTERIGYKSSWFTEIQYSSLKVLPRPTSILF